MRFPGWTPVLFWSFCTLSVPGSSLAAPPAPPATPRVVEGIVEVQIADDFAGKRSWEMLFLRDPDSGETYRLEFPQGRPAELRSGDRVTVEGMLQEKTLSVGEVLVSPRRSARGEGVAPAAVVAGGLRSVVLIVNLSDAAVACTPAQIANMMYGGSSSVDALYREMSFGLVSFPGDTNQDGQPDVFGPFTVPGTKSFCDPVAWAEAADAAAASSGVDLFLYGFKVYVLPGLVSCPWGGLGHLGDESQITPTSCLGGSQCRSWIADCGMASIFAHELGHNIGMLHASEDLDNDGHVDPGSEYFDFSDVMGCCGAFHHANGPHKVEMGWLPAVPVSGSGTFSLAPLETSPAATSSPQVLKVLDLYFLSYRRPTGIDSSLPPPYSEATNVHRQRHLFDLGSDLAAGRSLGNTLWVSALDDGEAFQDLANGVTVRQLAHDADKATVEVTIDPPGRQFHTVFPCRWIDTRTTFGSPWPLVSGQELIFRVAGRCGIPASARALAANVTVTGPTAAGHLILYPPQFSPTSPSASTINFTGGKTRANNALLPLSPDGYQALAVLPFVLGNGQVHLIVDVVGYFE